MSQLSPLERRRERPGALVRLPPGAGQARLLRGLFVSIALLGGLMAAMPAAHAVVLYSSATSNTTAPSAADGLDGWNLQGTWGGFLATPIADHFFIAAKHVPVVSSITVGAQTYTVDSSFNGVGYADDPDSDLRIVKITGTFASYAPLYNAAVDGSEIGKTLAVFGRGRDRGIPVTVGSDEKGWEWGTSTGLMSWGKNVATRFDNYSAGSPDSLLAFDFDGGALAIASEGALAQYDSSGGVFIESGGQWKLAGINYAIDSPWSYTGTDAGFFADIYDGRGLYWKESGVWVAVPSSPDPVPGASYASRISGRLSWITSVVPEPGTVGLLAAGAAMLVLLGVNARRRSARSSRR